MIGDLEVKQEEPSHKPPVPGTILHKNKLFLTNKKKGDMDKKYWGGSRKKRGSRLRWKMWVNRIHLHLISEIIGQNTGSSDPSPYVYKKTQVKSTVERRREIKMEIKTDKKIHAEIYGCRLGASRSVKFKIK